jgi:predicted transcriptional regulator
VTDERQKKKIRLDLRLAEIDKERLDFLAEALELSASGVIRAAIRREYERVKREGKTK